MEKKTKDQFSLALFPAAALKSLVFGSGLSRQAGICGTQCCHIYNLNCHVVKHPRNTLPTLTRSIVIQIPSRWTCKAIHRCIQSSSAGENDNRVSWDTCNKFPQTIHVSDLCCWMQQPRRGFFKFRLRCNGKLRFGFRQRKGRCSKTQVFLTYLSVDEAFRSLVVAFFWISRFLLFSEDFCLHI